MGVYYFLTSHHGRLLGHGHLLSHLQYVTLS